MYVMGEYDRGLEHILHHGVWKSNKRTGVRTLAICGLQTRFPLADRLPVMTRRQYSPKSVFAELLWFISGSTNNNDLVKLGAKFWTPWVSEEFEKKNGYAPGSFGPVYGFQLRHFGGYYGNGIGGKCEAAFGGHPGANEREGIMHNMDEPHNLYGQGGFDQLEYMMGRIKDDPSCRRIMFSLWNPTELPYMRLPPCHYTYQVMIDDNGFMSGHLTQRSNDYPVGVPANIQFYSALTCMIAQQTGYKPLEFVHEAVDAHIYENQIEQVKEYLGTPMIDSPEWVLNKAPSIDKYVLEDFQVQRYRSGPKIDIPVAV